MSNHIVTFGLTIFYKNILRGGGGLGGAKLRNGCLNFTSICIFRSLKGFMIYIFINLETNMGVGGGREWALETSSKTANPSGEGKESIIWAERRNGQTWVEDNGDWGGEFVEK